MRKLCVYSYLLISRFVIYSFIYLGDTVYGCCKHDGMDCCIEHRVVHIMRFMNNILHSANIVWHISNPLYVKSICVVIQSQCLHELRYPAKFEFQGLHLLRFLYLFWSDWYYHNLVWYYCFIRSKFMETVVCVNIHNCKSSNLWSVDSPSNHGPLTRYKKLRVAHASGMPGTFSPPMRLSDPNMHPSTCVTHVPGCMLGSLASGFIWSRWRGKHSQRSWRMRNPQFCVSGKRPMQLLVIITTSVRNFVACSAVITRCYSVVLR